jgi:SAM-dependent methyltransferase
MAVREKCGVTMDGHGDCTKNDELAVLSRQHRWFAGRRNALLRRVGFTSAGTILDLGCGPGFVLSDLRRRAPGTVAGLDRDEQALRNVNGLRVAGLGEALPFSSESLDLVVSQMVFLWFEDPGSVLREIHRVLRVGGALAVVAEPDYGGAVEHPDAGALRQLREKLTAEGGDIQIARKMPGLIAASGLSVEDCGMHSVKPVEAAREGSCYASPELLGAGGAIREFLFVPYFWFLARRTV